MAKEKLNTYWGEVSTLHLPKIATIERNFISSSFYSIIANRFLTKNRYHSLISSSLHLFIANRLALATSFLLLLITSFLVPSSLLSQIPAYVPTNGLVGYWPFNGNANDESGNGNHGAVNGATLTPDRNGNANSAYSFDGVDDFISVSNSNSLSIVNDICISFWFKSHSTTLGFLFDRDICGIADDWQFVWVYDKIGFYTSSSHIFSNTINNNTWNNAVVTREGGLMKLFLNSILIGSLITNNNPFANSTLPIFFCDQVCNSDSAPNFNGDLDDIAIYNRALTQEEITALYTGETSVSGCTNTTACNYNASATQDDGSCTFPAQTYLNCAGTCINDADNDGTCDELETPTIPSYLPSNGLVGYWPFNGNANDESGNGNHGTVNGATLTSDRNGNANSAYSFDGSINSIYFNNTSDVANFGTGDFSILQWFKSTSALSGHFCNSLYKFGGDNFYYDITPRSINSGLPQFHFGSNGDWNAIGNSSIDNGDWFLLCGVRNANTIQFYINGTLQSTTEIPINASANNTGNLGVFPNPCSASTPIEVYIDDIAIYNRALTQEEITALYNGTTNGGVGGNGGTAGTPAPSVPQGIPYQAMIRDNSGAALMNTPVTVRFSLRQDSIDGTVEYQETQALTTNAFGLINTQFGIGTPTQGTFAGINWSNTIKFIQVEANTGSGYVDMGTQQMMSVPFALQSNKATMIKNAGLPVYANNAAALAGGLVAGDMYRTATGDLKIVY